MAAVLSALLLTLPLFFQTAAQAATDPYALALQTVAERPYTRFDQTNGFHAGSYHVRPSLAAETFYSDNIRYSASHRQSDMAARVTPMVTLRSLRRDRGADMAVQAQQVVYKTYTAQNQSNAAFRLSPFFDLADGWRFIGQTNVQYDHELPAAESAQPLANAPTPYTSTQLGGRLRHDPGRILTEFGLAYTHVTFQNTALITGQRAVNNDRNRSDRVADVTIGIQDAAHDQMIGWNHALLQQNFTRADYDPTTDRYAGANRDNQGWRSVLLTRWSMTHLITLDAKVGAEHRAFAASQWRDRTVPVGQIKLLYKITPLTNVHVRAEQQIATTAFDTASAFTLQDVGITLWHELRRNIVLQAGLNRAYSRYWDHNRQDDTITARLQATYYQTPSFRWQANYHYQQRDSNVALAAYRENRVMLGAHFQF